MSLFLFQKRNSLTDLESKFMIVKGEGWGGGIVREFGMDMDTLLYLKWITNTVLFIAQGTLLNVMWQPEWEKGLGENRYMYMYG